MSKFEFSGLSTDSYTDIKEFIEYQDNKYGVGVIGKVINVTADVKVMKGENVDIESVGAIAFDPFTHGYYKVSERVGDAFKDGLKIKQKEKRKCYLKNLKVYLNEIDINHNKYNEKYREGESINE